jgi:hypothetical protein
MYPPDNTDPIPTSSDSLGYIGESYEAILHYE